MPPKMKDVFTTRIVSAVRQIVPAVEEIWLYGSRARGNFRPDSDYDLIIVAPGSSDGTELSKDLSSIVGADVDARTIEQSEIDRDSLAALVIKGIDIDDEFDQAAIDFHRGQKIWPDE